MIDLKMIKHNEFKLQKKTFSPLEVLQFIMSLLSPQASDQRIEFSLKTVSASLLNNLSCVKRYGDLLETPLPDKLEGDEVRLKQVLINLVKNALKFTRRGYVRILAGYDEQ